MILSNRDSRALAIQLLSQEQGLSEDAYISLYETILIQPHMKDVLRYVEATDGCFYLPEGWNK